MSLPRKNPRLEWIARNRLHPDHAQVMAEQGASASPSQWMGPAGLVRRDPHRIGSIGPNGIKRIDRSGLLSSQAAASPGRQAKSEPQKPLVTIDEPAFIIAVVPDMAGGELTSHDRDVLGMARQLADADPARQGAVLAVVFGSHRETRFEHAGVDRLLHLGDERLEGYSPERRLGQLEALEREYLPERWVFPDSQLGGAELGRRLSVRLRERPATQVWQLLSRDNEWACECRGARERSDIVRTLPRCILALEECAEPVSETRHEVRAVELEGSVPEAMIRIDNLGQVAVDPASVALGEAEFILSGGNGIKNWDRFHHAAVQLRAAEGASRVAVDNGFMPRERQVGATGTWVSARVYIAVGISGAIQHLQGIERCNKVVAINRDMGCDMVKRADLAVIGDAEEILEALVALIDQKRTEEARHEAA
ncbi:electron transfer flavoprotein subunit alpha [Larsenimonas rhizosphaerae]|uniref:Electron transfer flavoprotein subunit alpha/FixB family protein n=1 Tax=Larsenimonas rhizosphaerae TaxID=2944682 RepID=A0AA41ZG18_9GAMM|nr:electron transfer flavoprotein subunit alpha/FixB family protein [Larsenimonas rhizosphaerae]MCX2523966.1 electron transfer flavoprotein subunit alpha/FixB family protein [Larsenimonas rhizosphaerae]